MGVEGLAGLAMELGDRRARTWLDPLRSMLKLYGKFIGSQLTSNSYEEFL